MFVIRPTSGAAMAASRAISPGLFVPISTMASSCPVPQPEQGQGKADQVVEIALRLEDVPRSRRRSPRPSPWSSSFPELPVIATSGMGNRRRQSRAMSPSARRVSGTPIDRQILPARRRVFPKRSARMRSPAAPVLRPAARQSWPSKFSPARAMKRFPAAEGPRVRGDAPAGPAGAAPKRGASRGLQDLLGGKDRRVVRHDPSLPVCQSVSSSRAITRSSKGNFRAADDLVILVALPGDQDDVRGSRPDRWPRRWPLSGRG